MQAASSVWWLLLSRVKLPSLPSFLYLWRVVVHGALSLNGNVVRFASTPNQKICHWGVFVGRQEGVACRFQFAIDGLYSGQKGVKGQRVNLFGCERANACKVRVRVNCVSQWFISPRRYTHSTPVDQSGRPANSLRPTGCTRILSWSCLDRIHPVLSSTTHLTPPCVSSCRRKNTCSSTCQMCVSCHG